MVSATTPIVERLLDSPEPSISWKVLVGVLGEASDSKRASETRQQIKTSPRVQALLARRNSDGQLKATQGVYSKWKGAHWVLSTLADIGYPPGDESLRPMANQLLDEWLDKEFFAEFEAKSKASSYSKRGVPVIQGRHRRCASQQSNALWTILKLGLYSPRCDQLAERLLHWQWPDGGWNCDKNPNAQVSSFNESLIPLRALSLYERMNPDSKIRAAVDRAAEVFLSRQLFMRRSTGKVIKSEFTKLHYPLYWHYDVLGGLKAMAEIGKIDDPRCGAALDLLESRRLADGGWPSEAKYYIYRSGDKGGSEFVDWGGTSKSRLNEWVTADALAVLAAAGR